MFDQISDLSRNNDVGIVNMNYGLHDGIDYVTYNPYQIPKQHDNQNQKLIENVLTAFYQHFQWNSDHGKYPR